MTSEERRAFHFSLKESVSQEAKRICEQQDFETDAGRRGQNTNFGWVWSESAVQA